mmetsp:Transcript_21667/g.77182  ORF Transcript_21667/g.77182 Transcript_21667/m.77182 type:complete len:233 (+) Transcript_21667:5075-5773(+)
MRDDVDAARHASDAVPVAAPSRVPRRRTKSVVVADRQDRCALRAQDGAARRRVEAEGAFFVSLQEAIVVDSDQKRQFDDTRRKLQPQRRRIKRRRGDVGAVGGQVLQRVRDRDGADAAARAQYSQSHIRRVLGHFISRRGPGQRALVAADDVRELGDRAVRPVWRRYDERGAVERRGAVETLVAARREVLEGFGCGGDAEGLGLVKGVFSLRPELEVRRELSSELVRRQLRI